MYKNVVSVVFLLLIVQACGGPTRKDNETAAKNKEIMHPAVDQLSYPMENTIEKRFSTPDGYRRSEVDSGSFQHYLRQLPLKKVNSKVTYFDGSFKPNSNVYEAVIDLPIGKRDLHQCADAIIRLRAEYFFKEKKYDSIGFNFTNGFRADYIPWRNGKRIKVSGNQVRWTNGTTPSTSYIDFWKYLEMVFSYAGTASLEKEMKPISLDAIDIGDTFIKGGFPGHAIIVVDMAIHQESGKKIVLLAQSYMPAQELQLLKNPNDSVMNPWYSMELTDTLYTPEWTFEIHHLKRF
ncbi:MAG: DUF4846 domain-containing protein [Maribacter sp.]